jgi:hypothetical protein
MRETLMNPSAKDARAGAKAAGEVGRGQRMEYAGRSMNDPMLPE